MGKHTRSNKLQKSGPARRTLRIAGILALLSTLGGITLYREAIRFQIGKVLAFSEESEPIPVLSLERGPLELDVQAGGEIVGLNSVPVSTPGTGAGSLKLAWLINEGTWVAKGDPVMRFDSTDQRLELESQTHALNENLMQSKVDSGNQQLEEKSIALDLAEAQEDYEYTTNVLPEDETIYSKWEIIVANLDAGFAKARIDNLAAKAKIQKRLNRSLQQASAITRNQVQTEVGIIRQTLDALEVHAPSDGLVLYHRERRQDPKIGDGYQAGQVLIDLVDLKALQARIYVLEREAGGLTKGKRVSLKLDALPDTELHGELSSVSSVAATLERDSPLKYFTCNVTIRDGGPYLHSIKPGMTLQASVILERYDSCFMVPASALDVKDDTSYVYIKQGEGFVQRQVQIGIGKHGQATILSGVNDKEQVALRNPFETRQPKLPDFGKASASTQERRPGPGGDMMRMSEPPGGNVPSRFDPGRK
jgi:multidrug efflux pump subunit AcrA (membrane-fusion protein)